MFFIFIFTFVQLILFSLFTMPISEDGEVLFIVINSLFVAAFLRLKYPKYFLLFMIGYFLRIALLAIDYGTAFPVLHSGADTEMFHRIASENALKGNYDRQLTNYTIILTWLYILLGECRLIAQYINVLFGMGVLVYLAKTFETLDLNEKLKKKALLIAVLFPHLIIFSGILLREVWVQFFVVISLFYFVRWLKHNRIGLLLLTVISVLAASWMHAGTLLVTVGYLIAFAFYYPKLEKSKVSFGAVITLCFLILGSIVFLTFTDVFTDKFNSFELGTLQEYGLHNVVVHGGESAYLTWINPNSPFQLLLFSPLKMFYFLFSPIPLDWRGLQDVIAFFLDAVIYLFLIYTTLKYYGKLENGMKKNILKYLLIAVFFSVFVFAYGTTNAGTAIRHRCKIFSLVLTAYAVSVSEKKKYRTYYLQNQSP